MHLPALAKSIAVLFETLMAFCQPPLLGRWHMTQVAEPRWLARRGYHGRVVRVANQLDMVGRRRHVFDMQIE
jgi:hypothetical protein